MLTEVSVDALMHRHFHAQFARPVGWREVPFSTLTPYHRSVLLTDGTVTRTLEALVLEQVQARRIVQYQMTAAAAGDGWLELKPTDPVLVRHVDLVGSRSETRYARAESVIAPNRLPSGFTAALAAEPEGIGAALHAAAAESFRQLLYYGRTDDAVCARCYRIFIAGRPALVIREWFLR
ncbi:chorismate--pyruvate lyase family protein [Nocardia sp. NPDC127526]|uniref:chorismate--pyruvate lyase family protein n=1 Tax=Nocardia sp. NPDC127526 TaxID=3345393 RepID=UPI0036311C24